jgi:hypothetical protein
VLLNIFAISLLRHLNHARDRNRAASLHGEASDPASLGEGLDFDQATVTPDMVFSAVAEVMAKCKGGFVAPFFIRFCFYAFYLQGPVFIYLSIFCLILLCIHQLIASASFSLCHFTVTRQLR